MKRPKGFRGKYFSLAAILALNATLTLASNVQSVVDTQEQLERKSENATSEEDSNLRERFKSLEKNNYINVFWADNIPYRLTLTDKGNSYNFSKARVKSLNPAVTNLFFKSIISLSSCLYESASSLFPTYINFPSSSTKASALPLVTV